MTKKKSAYPEYRKARDEMQELLRAQKNIELFFETYYRQTKAWIIVSGHIKKKEVDYECLLRRIVFVNKSVK